jgi:hypothetical protein
MFARETLIPPTIMIANVKLIIIRLLRSFTVQPPEIVISRQKDQWGNFDSSYFMNFVISSKPNLIYSKKRGLMLK